jgi:glutamate 5-kinase
VTDIRNTIASASRVVVKIGSSSLTQPDGGLDAARIGALVDQLAARISQGHQVVLVSSGAIATGFPALGLSARP